MRRKPFLHRSKIVRVNIAARFSHIHPHLMVVIGKLANREIVMGVFCQDSLKGGNTLLYRYQLVPVAYKNSAGTRSARNAVTGS